MKKRIEIRYNQSSRINCAFDCYRQQAKFRLIQNIVEMKLNEFVNMNQVDIEIIKLILNS